MIFFSLFLHSFLLFYTGAGIPNKWMMWLYYFFAAIFSMSQLLKIMHWPFGNEGLAMGSIICLAIAGYYFVNNPKRKLQDYFLIVWLLLVAISFVAMDMPREIHYYLNIVAGTLLGTNIIYALILQFRGEQE